MVSEAGAQGKPRAAISCGRCWTGPRAAWSSPRSTSSPRRTARSSRARRNVVVMADEAHRSQYGFVEGGARWMREALPNATFVGFTGTPLERDDKNTIHVFGEYADVYDIRQAVEDGATKPLYYESRIVKLTVDEAGAASAEAEIDGRRQGRPQLARTTDDSIRVPLEALVGAPERIERAGGVHRRALGEAARGDGRQGDGRDHEPRHRRAAVRGDPRAAARSGTTPTTSAGR
ncbi:MAG: hypothetical protein V9E87_01980 [Gemmatimonadales bacterium]